MIFEVETQYRKLIEVLEEPKNWITQLFIYFDSGRLSYELNASQRIRFRLNTLNYCKIDYVLYKKHHDGMLLR